MLKGDARLLLFGKGDAPEDDSVNTARARAAHDDARAAGAACAEGAARVESTARIENPARVERGASSGGAAAEAASSTSLSCAEDRASRATAGAAMPRRGFLRWAGLFAGAAAFGVVPLSLAGCRESDVLTQKIIGEPLQYEVDYSLSPVALENPLSNSNISDHLDDSNRQDSQQEDSPKYDDQTQTTDEQANSTRQDDLNLDDTTAQSGKTTGNGASSAQALDGSSSAEKKGSSIKFDFTGGDTATDHDANAPDSGSDADPDSSPEDWNPGDDAGSSDKGSDPTIIGSDDLDQGNIPSTVGRIAAAGINATLVQAIGGKPGGNVLACADAGWLGHLSDAQRAQVFPGETDGVKRIDGWGEDGATWSDAVVAQILDAFGDFTQGTVAVVAGYGTMSENVAATFQQKGVHVVELRPMGMLEALDADIAANVKAVGQLLRGMSDDGALANERVQAWQQLHTQAVEGTFKKNGGYTCVLRTGTSWNYKYHGGMQQEAAPISSNRSYALYFDTWATAKRATIVPQSTGYGARAIDSDYYSVWPIGSWPGARQGSLAIDISDGVGLVLRYPKNVKKSDYLLISYYMQISGAANLSVWDGKMRTGSSPTDGEYFRYSMKDGYLNNFCTWNGDLGFRVGGLGSTDFALLGDDAYPFLVVRDASMAAKIASSAEKADKSALSVGFFNTGKDYGVVACPCGVAGNWVDGTFESFLLAPYFWCLYGGRQGTSISFSYSDEFVNSFYSAMYRCGSRGILDAAGNGGDGTTGQYGNVATVHCGTG